MALTKEQKQKIIEDLKEKIDRQKSMVFVAIEGLKAAELFDLREKLKKADCNLTVVKKTLLNIVFKEKKFGFETEKLEGQLALIFGFGDEILPTKIAYQFSSGNKNLKILGGYFENKFREAEEMITLGKIPSKQELLSSLVGSIAEPIQGFVSVLQGNIKGLIYILKQAKA